MPALHRTVPTQKNESDPGYLEALRGRCTFVVGGPLPDPGAELAEIGAWCREHGHVADRYGEGALVGAFEQKIAAILGFEAAVFMPSGTMAQQIAMRIHAETTGIPAFAMHPTSHLELHEQRGYARVQRLDAVLLGPRLRPTLADDLRAWPERLAALLVELPAREIGGQLPSWDELAALSSLARSRGIRMHMDGARLWEAREAYAPRTHAEICAHFDSVYVSFYKGIGALAGAALAGSKAFVDEARLWRKRMGGTLVQLHPFVASAAMRFDQQLARMAPRRDAAIALGRALASVEGIRVLPDPPQVCMFHLHFPAGPEAMLAARNAVAEAEGLWVPGGFVAGPAPGTSSVEIYVGDATAALDPARVAQAYAKVVARALAA